VDDTHTLHFQLFYTPGAEVVDPAADLPVEWREPYKLPPDRLHPFSRYTMDSVLAQDHAMWETQGPIADRSLEHLSYSDRGVSLLRKVMHEELDKVARGDDPMGLYRGEEGLIVDTNYEESVKAEGSAVPALVTAEAHKIKVPVSAD
jgi:5,5'-dehydrodivanillate O-demethylase oxygenase subunit